MDDQEEYLIAYANLKGNLINKQKDFLSPSQLKIFFSNSHLGFPICLPSKIKYFDYKKAKYFKINKKQFGKKIFKTNNINYIGIKKFFRYGDIFAYNIKLKNQYQNKLKKYQNNILLLRKKIKKLKLKRKICAMQIRNVPHFGHEAVFKHILSKFDCLYLNPIYGIKKRNDFSNVFISKALNFIKKKYKNIEFDPLWTNFHYAGPREAIHHLLMREQLGFNYFYVGRDHAGAENLYKNEAAIKLVKKNSNKFKIKSFISKGGFYCLKCKKYVIKGACRHKNLKNISGTEFRKFIFRKKIYKHADIKMQKILFN